MSFRYGHDDIDLYLEQGTDRVPADGGYYIVLRGEVIESLPSQKRGLARLQQLRFELPKGGEHPAEADLRTKMMREEMTERFLRQSSQETSFSYSLNETGEERFVGVPEQGGQDLISTDPLPAGTVYGSSVGGDGTVGLYRVEVSLSSGTGNLKPAGGVTGALKESISRAHSYMQSHKVALGIGRELDTQDFHVEVIDLLGNKANAELGVAYYVAAFSAIRGSQVHPGLMVLGDMSIQGNIKGVHSLSEPLRVGMDTGAQRALVPIESKRQLLEVEADVLEHVDAAF